MYISDNPDSMRQAFYFGCELLCPMVLLEQSTGTQQPLIIFFLVEFYLSSNFESFAW